MFSSDYVDVLNSNYLFSLGKLRWISDVRICSGCSRDAPQRIITDRTVQQVVGYQRKAVWYDTPLKNIQSVYVVYDTKVLYINFL